MSTLLPLDMIGLDGGTQPRAALDDVVVQDYADAMRDGAILPPVTVYQDGGAYWLADGFLRYHAARRVGHFIITVEVRQGTRREAVLHAVGANATHGLRRTNADKRHAVVTLLQDPEWAHWSDNKIGQLCTVDHKTVANYRMAYLGNSQDSPTRTVERGGHVYKMDTGNIGSALDGDRLHEVERQIDEAITDMKVADREMGEKLKAVAAKLTPEQYGGWLATESAHKDSGLLALGFMADQDMPTASAILRDVAR